MDRLAPDSDELDGARELRDESAELSLMMLNGEEPDAPRSADEIAREKDELAGPRAWAARRIRAATSAAPAPAADAPASKRRRPPKAADLCDVKVVIGNEDLYWGHPSDDDAPGSRHYTTARRSSRLQPAAAAPAAANAKKRRR